MADDINFLSSASKPGNDAAPKKPKAAPGEMSMHVPEPAKPDAPKDAGAGFLDGLRGLVAPSAPKGPAPEDVFRPKVSTPQAAPAEPNLPKKSAPPVMRVPPPPPPPKAPAPPAPKTAIKPSMPAAKPEKSGTLRVSLISTAAGGSLSELTIRDRLRTIILILVLALVVDGLIEGGLLYYKSTVEKRISGIEAGIKGIDDQIAKEEQVTMPAKNLQALLKGADNALKNHRHWTQVLAVLESLIKPEVRLTNLTGGDTGSLLSGMVAKDYTTLAKQIMIFKADPRVISYDYGNGASKGEGGVSTTLNLQLDPKLFLLGQDKK